MTIPNGKIECAIVPIIIMAGKRKNLDTMIFEFFKTLFCKVETFGDVGKKIFVILVM